MKYLLAVIALLLPLSITSAITVEEIGRLSQLKTSDDVLLQLIDSSPLEKPLSPSQTISLKENGVSERVIASLLKRSDSHPELLPKQDSQSYWLNQNVRYYYTTKQDGTKGLVVTNLDEKGKRMGPPPPPKRKRPEPETQMAQRQPYYEAPRENYIPERMYETRMYEPLPEYYRSAPVFSDSYYSPYSDPGFIPDYPGSTFGFHLFPQFVRINTAFPRVSRIGFSHRFPPPRFHFRH